MTAATWESNIMTLKDKNDNPLYQETYNPVTGELECRFNGKEVVLVENDLGLFDFDTATDGQPVMLYFRPEDYAINSNMALGFKRYFDDDKNKWVNKGLTIVDGKLLDARGAYIIKKSITA
jgi:HK97 family phage major capsid protein